MEQRALGSSGMRIGRLGLGTMTWGRTTDEFDAREQLRSFVDAGGQLVDTANVYADGNSERLLGQLIREEDLREHVVIATKVGSRPGTERRFDLSRKHLNESVVGSLRRLGVDSIDLLQLHAWDPNTPLTETFDALAGLVRSGKVRYVGVSNFAGWQTALAQQESLRTLGNVIVSTQVEYSLLQRGVEREVLPLGSTVGLGILPWSPLGRGVLTGKYRTSTPSDSRAANPSFSGFISPYLSTSSGQIVDAVCTAAEGLDAHPSQVALAWLRTRPGVVAPIVGARTASQLKLSLEAEHLDLPDAVTEALNEISSPVLGYPDSGWNQVPRLNR